MAGQATLSYVVEPAGASSLSIVSLMNAAAVPVPVDLLQAAGLRVVADATAPIGGVVRRDIDIVFGPTALATAVATLDNEGRVTGVNVTAPGDDYVLPPEVSFVGGGNPTPSAQATAFLNLQGATIVDGGSGYSAQSFGVVLGAMAPPFYKILPVPPPDWQAARGLQPSTGVLPQSVVQALTVAVQGKGYSNKTVLQFNGGLDPSNPNARPATGRVTLGPKGRIVAVQLTDPGEGYIRVPQVVVFDPEHTGGGFMIVQPNPITGAAVNPTTTSSQFVVANIAALMGQGIAATVGLTIAGGIVTGVTVTGNGQRYTQLPQILVIDPTGAGSGAIITPRMGVGSIELKAGGGGRGYESVPSVVLTDFFKSLFPDGPAQALPFVNLMTPAIANSVMSPVTAIPPVLT